MKTVAVFGATSAIAEHVARLYAAQGAKLFLAGRDPERLERICDDLRARGAGGATAYSIDLTQIERISPMLDACVAELGGIDVALIAFGTLPDQANAEKDIHATRREMLTNFVSPACLIGELVERMLPAGKGVIGAISSVAGDRGRRSNYIYGASKAALGVFLEGLRHRLHRTGIAIVTIKPGFVDTPMTAAMSKGGPLWATPAKVARDIQAGLEKRVAVLYTPWFWKYVMLIIRFLPTPIFNRLNI